ncbi:MAG: hypothetical protein KKD01_05270 [Proteobacteria bacterium]|nr:hypothetical protein [Pseudomonadota bacterium]MBU1140388.1 hypothetical protein [Pseudomonadota bacterium]MBU1417296.1 hypothetical protein [Pseudomonadota bacterium]MBU1454119.1 hypothetical protein [Pseudomonadota bacterium]
MKKTMTLIAALVFMLTALASVHAATLKCTVEKVEGTMVTMNCGDKAADLSAGTNIKVKTEKGSAAIEGC